jgi:hypothetical protein
VVDAYVEAIAAADDADENASSDLEKGHPSDENLVRGSSGVPQRAFRPPVSRGLKIGEYSQGELRSIVRWIKSDTLLRTRDQLLQSTMDELGFSRRGKLIVDAISQAIDAEDNS